MSVDLHGWRDAIASDTGPPSTTRLVLLVLSLRMDRKTGACFPSIRYLATATGLSPRAVSTHLREAARAGWIEIGRRDGKAWRSKAYSLAWPDQVVAGVSPERGSGDRRSVDRRSGDRGDPVTGTTVKRHPCVNHPKNQPESPAPGSGDPGSGAILFPGVRSADLRRTTAPWAPRAVPNSAVGPTGPPVGDRGATAAQGPNPGLSLTDLANGLRDRYPHPTNRGAKKKVPSPLSIEKWLAASVCNDDLGPDDYGRVLAAAERERATAEERPDDFRVLLKNWIKDACWGETIAEDTSAPVLPPKSTGPRFTPTDWNQPKENHGRLDNRGGA